jgi:CO dehydrogenase maturation factor
MLDGSTRRRDGVVADAVHDHRVALERLRDRAAAELRAIDLAVVGAARAQLGVRIAVIGKGGAGKTLVASTLARLLGRRGRHVLAVDLDPNPGLTFGLGMDQTDAGLPREALDRDDDGGWMTMLAPDLDAIAAVERFSTPAPDGVRYLGIGKISDPERTAFRRSMGPLFQIVLNIADPDWNVIGDLEAGGSTPFQGYHFFAERVLLVVGPSWKSALTARRLQRLLCGVPSLIVANRFRNEADHPGLSPDVRIPFDQGVIEADRIGAAPIDHCPDGPAVRAINDLSDTLIHEEVLV